MDPSTEGKRTRHFQGLETPPIVTHDVKGRLFDLRARDLGSVQIGSPVYYRWVDVGRVVASDLDESGDFATLQVFVRSPHDERVGTSTRFWNASGIDVTLSSEGFEIDSVSLTSILIGGVAFDTPGGMPASPAPEHATFTLFKNKRATDEPELRISRPFLLHFEDSAGGLDVGSPVEFRGIKIGEVRSISMVLDEDALPIIPVVIAIQPERVGYVGEGEGDDPKARWDRMVKLGMRAQLKTGNILTGKLAVALDFHEDAAPARINYDGPIPELPTIPSSLEELTAGLMDFVKRLGTLPIEGISADLRAALQSADRVLESADGLVARDSDTVIELRRAIRELADAARSARLLADQLEQHPESLIRGKGASN